METNRALELQAMAIYRQYGFFLPAPVKEFLRKLADHLQWTDLKGLLK
jgi:hypothetical protein